MRTMHELFDGSDMTLIDAARAAFEADAEPYGFDLTRRQSADVEPWSEYVDDATGHRWGGWLAATSAESKEIARLREALQTIRLATYDNPEEMRDGLAAVQNLASAALKTPQ